MTTVERPPLTVRPMVEADEPAVLALLSASLAGGPTGERTAEFFRWKHVDNPFGPSYTLLAEADGNVVGLRAFLRWRFRAGSETGSETVDAVRAVDTATHPDHQGRGIFRTLTLAALDDLGTSIGMVFNTPNGNSLPGYLKMGWQIVGTVPIALRPVRPLRFGRRAVAALRRTGTPATPTLPDPGWDSAVDVLADREVADLVHETCAGGPPDARLGTDTSLGFYRWRYAAPGLGYRAVAVRRAGAVVGVGFGRVRERGGLAELTLADLVARPGDRDACARLLRAAARTGTDHVATHLAPGTDAAAVAWRCGYVQLPKVGMTFVANPRRPVHPDPAALASWRLTLGDLEVF